MKSVADMKRALRPGVEVTVVSAPWWPAMEGVTREVVQVQTKQFTLRTVKSNGEVVESYCDFPKATDATFDGELVTFPRFSGKPEMGSMTYRIAGA